MDTLHTATTTLNHNGGPSQYLQQLESIKNRLRMMEEKYGTKLKSASQHVEQPKPSPTVRPAIESPKPALPRLNEARANFVEVTEEEDEAEIEFEDAIHDDDSICSDDSSLDGISEFEVSSDDDLSVSSDESSRDGMSEFGSYNGEDSSITLDEESTQIMNEGTKTLNLLQATLVTGEVWNDNPAKVETENGEEDVPFDPDDQKKSPMAVTDTEVESGVDTNIGMQIVVLQGAVDASIDSVNSSLDGMSDLEPRNFDDFVSPVGEITEDQVNWMMVKDTIEPDKVTVVEVNQQPNLNIINVEDTLI